MNPAAAYVLTSLPQRPEKNESVLKARATVALHSGNLPTISSLLPRPPLVPVVEASNDILNEAEMAYKLLRSNNNEELERFLVFLSSNNVKTLERVLSLIPESNQLQKNESVLKARAAVAFHLGDFKEVYSILQSNKFSERNHQELQKLWYDAHYLEAEMVRGRPLPNGSKWYFRQKFPLPMTIWDGEKTSYNFKV